MEENPEPKVPAPKPGKIRPRNVDKPRESDAGETSPEEKPKVGPLPKRSDPAWLANLRPHESAKESAKTEESPVPEIAAEKEADEPPAPAEAEPPEEIPAADDSSTGEGGPESPRLRRRKKKKEGDPSGLGFLHWLGGPGKFVVAGAVCAAIAGGMIFKWGVAVGTGEGRTALERELAVKEARRVYALPPEAQARVDAAMAGLRAGKAEEALGELSKISEEYPDVASMRYLAALAAIQAGKPEDALRFAEASISRGEKVADSLVVESIVESQRASLPANEKLGDPMMRAQQILEKAIVEDPAAAGPRVELGSLLRYRGQRDGAVRELRAAKARLHPVDSHLVIDVTVALIEVEELPAGALEISDPATDDVRALFPAAYVAMKKDDFLLAKRLLDRCKAVLPADTFLYLVNDPAFRKFAYREDLKPYFGD